MTEKKDILSAKKFSEIAVWNVALT